MDLRHLRYFVAVARELHFGRAAERLHVAQPAVSQQIRALEADLTVRLLDRHSRGVALTPAGRALFQEAVTLLEHAERLAATVRAVGHGRRGVLRINYVRSAPSGPTADIVEEFQRRFPDVTLLIDSSTTAINVAQLARGDVDAAFVRPPVEAPTLSSLVMAHDTLVAAIPAHHALARQSRIARTRLRQEKIVSWPRVHAPGLYDAIQSQIFGAQEPRIVRTEPDSEHMVRAVARGVGIAITTASRAATLNLPGVVIRRFTAPMPTAPIALAWRRDDASSLVRGLLQLAREMQHKA